MSSMFCNKIYVCKNADWCGRDFKPKSYGCFEAKTHFEVIQSMSPVGLAEFITTKGRTFGEEYEGFMSALDWLNETVSEDDEVC